MENIEDNMGHSNYKLTDEQKGLLLDITHSIIEEIEKNCSQYSCLDVYYTPDGVDNGRFDNNKFTAMVWYVGDQLSAY